MARAPQIKCYWVLENIRVTAFTVSELLRENQQGEGGKVTHPPPRLGLKVLRHPDLKILAKKSNTLFFCMNRYLKCIMHKTMLWKTTKSQKNFLIYLPSKHIFTAWNVSIFGVNQAPVLPHSDWVREIRSIRSRSPSIQSECGKTRARIAPNKDTFYTVLLSQIPRFTREIWLFFIC